MNECRPGGPVLRIPVAGWPDACDGTCSLGRGVSAEAHCAHFHKPLPRKRAAGGPPHGDACYESEAAGGVKEGAQEPAQLQAG